MSASGRGRQKTKWESRALPTGPGVFGEKGLKQIGSVDELEAIVKEIIAANPDNVALYKSGKDRVFGFTIFWKREKAEELSVLLKKIINK